MKYTYLAGLLLGLLMLFPLPAKSQQSGVFDYYLFNLSWSPEYCHGHPNSPECGKHLGFIVHGLWPEYKSNPSGPENCGNQPGLANPSSMLDLMPDLHLIAHEWSTHGTCSGLSANDYFALIRRLWTSIHIPTQFQQPTRQVIMQTSALKQAFEQANPGLTDSEIAPTCTGPYLTAVQFCFSKDGKLTPCLSVHQCSAPSLRVPAVR